MLKLKILTVVLAATAAFGTALAEADAADIPSNLPKLKPTDPLPANLFVELARAVNPAVVNIYTAYMPRDRAFQRDPLYDFMEQFMGPGRMGPQTPQQSLGTGFLIREDGLIVTNNHVVDRADLIKVVVSEGTKESFDAKIVGKDARTDIALIKIEAKRKLPFVKLGSSADVQVGEWVAAFGNPYGYGHTMTKGIISAIGREIDELNLFPFMQTDASINPGNSGGPLVNTQGQVIGVNTAIDARAQGIGFVIPIDNVKSILPQLEKEGSISRGMIGVQMAEIDEERSAAMNLKSAEGALIVSVVAGSPAEKAGIQPWDIVTEFAGTKVRSTRDLGKAVASTPAGKSVEVKLLRNAKPRTVTVKVAGMETERTARRGESPTRREGRIEGLEAPFNLGFVVADYTKTMADTYNLPAMKEAKPVVLRVQNGSEAARAGLAPGDIILDINRTPVKKSKEALRLIKAGTVNMLRIQKPDRVSIISLRVP